MYDNTLITAHYAVQMDDISCEENTWEDQSTIYHRLKSYFSSNQIKKATACVEHMQRVINKPFNQTTVLVAYGGGKDSSYTMSYIRFLQLLALNQYGETFKIRVVTNRHIGMPKAVMDNVHRVYIALGMLADPSCEMFITEGNRIYPFNKDKVLDSQIEQLNRLDILMNGHISQGDGRPTFCNTCNLSMVNSFGIAAWYDGGVDLIITGDSKKEQRDYFIWIKRLSKELNINFDNQFGFQGFLNSVSALSEHYFKEVFGTNASEDLTQRFLGEKVDHPHFFSIYEYTEYDAGAHWELLTELLHFDFDDLAFSFSESDCANPAIMAHIRGLRAQIQGRSYAEGIKEYVQFALKIMERKNFPEQLMDIVKARYATPTGIYAMRARVSDYAHQYQGLSEDNLVCLLYSPFIDQGVRLDSYIQEVMPWLIDEVAVIKAVLSNNSDNNMENSVLKNLMYVSGLSLQQMQTLYRYESQSMRSGNSLITKILRDDPHKMIIKTRHSANGAEVDELISGR